MASVGYDWGGVKVWTRLPKLGNLRKGQSCCDKEATMHFWQKTTNK